uniref:Uncharacterized protein n=1 Tax=Anguilla anguilla TaxID=7936 RepID=A0A0E9VZ97_ANGAN
MSPNQGKHSVGMGSRLRPTTY